MTARGLVMRSAAGEKTWSGEEPVSIGSWRGASVPLDDAALWPVHVVLDPEPDGRWRLVALAPDGCLVNGRSVRRAMLVPGDVVQVGGHEIVVEGKATPAADTGNDGPVRATLRWKGTLVDARMVRPDEPLVVGRKGLFRVPIGEKGNETWVAAACLDGRWHIALDTPLRAMEIAGGAHPILTSSARTEGPAKVRGAQQGQLWAPMPEGKVRFESGELSVEIERAPLHQLTKIERPAWWITHDGQKTIIAFLFLLFCIGILTHPPEAPFMPGEEVDKRNELIAQFHAPPPKVVETELQKLKQKLAKDQQESASAKAQGKEGEAGKQDAPRRNAKQAGKATPEEIVKQHALLQALNSGATEKLLTGGALSAVSAVGHLDGPAAGDAQGTLGLGERGDGKGGGGLGADTVGVGPVGTKGGLGKAAGAGKLGKGGPSDLSMDEPASVVGGLDREVIRRVIVSHRAQVRYCYEKQLSATPNLAGKVLVEFVIGADGNVTTARPSEDTLSDAEVGKCIVGKVRTWTFPKPKGGGVVVVTYPFLFKPAGQGGE